MRRNRPLGVVSAPRRRNSAGRERDADDLPADAAAFLTPHAIAATAKPSRSESPWGRHVKRGARVVMFPLGVNTTKFGATAAGFAAGGPIGAGTGYMIAHAADRLSKEEEDAPARPPARKNRARRRRNPGGSRVQSLIFDRGVFTAGQAAKWAKAHGFKSAKIDTQPNTLRIRQAPPDRFDPRTYGTITLRPGVQAVVAVPLR